MNKNLSFFMTIFLVALLPSATFTTDCKNQHVRRIYFSEQDNMCGPGSSDAVFVQFFFEDR